MARLSSFRVDSKAIEDGEWVRPGEEFDDLEIQTRGFNDAYYDAQARKLRKAALQYGGDVSRVPNAIQRDIRIDCMIRHLYLDVRNLVDDTGQPVASTAFQDLLRNPDHADLVVAVMRAASMVGRARGADLESARGN